MEDLHSFIADYLLSNPEVDTMLSAVLRYDKLTQVNVSVSVSSDNLEYLIDCCQYIVDNRTLLLTNETLNYEDFHIISTKIHLAYRFIIILEYYFLRYSIPYKSSDMKGFDIPIR